MTTITTPPTETAEVSLPSARIYPSLRAAWVPLLALALAFFVEMVDNTILTIALPTIGRSFDASTTALQWPSGRSAPWCRLCRASGTSLRSGRPWGSRRPLWRR